jgi:uncharacterized protein (TIGR03089 family)
MWNDIAGAARACGSSPMYTWVNPIGRIELSGITFLNGVSKAANMMRYGLEVESGDKVYIDLGNHWQSPIWFAAALSIQAVVTSQPTGAVSIVDNVSIHQAIGSRERVVISRDPFGMPEKNSDSSAVNGSLEVRGYGDVFSPMGAFRSDDCVFTGDLGEMTLAQTRLQASQMIADNEVATGSRIAIADVPALITRAIWQVVVPVMSRCSVVLLDGDIDGAKVCEAERVDRLVVAG